MDHIVGKLLDNRYEIIERIGTGGMAVVYKARCHRLNRLVAVKVLRPELAQDADFRRRFHDESQAVAMLSHPNIMAVYDVSHSDDLDYIVMELLDGITLKQYMHKKGLPLNWREALHFITQIMKALSHAHSRGIIHLDIKPQNIMVLRDGSVKVTDFGIARVTSAAQTTLTQEALGSVHYISPEQARGSRIDTRADIYSAGVVLYEMTAGRLPFEGDSPVAVAIQHISSIPLPPRDLNSDIPEALEAINMKAMAHDVDKRYVSADAMLADLEEFRKNPSINFEYTQDDLVQSDVTDEPTIVRPVDESMGTRRRRRDYDENEDDYDDRRERGSVWPILLAIAAILIFIVGIGYFLWTTIFGGILADHSQELRVPNLLGMTIEEVNRDISLGKIADVFVIVEGATVTSDLPAGQIVQQDPPANESKKGEQIPITVDISSGPNQLFMPELINIEYRQAGSDLEKMGMKWVPKYENSEDITRNYVIRTEPQTGDPLSPGQTVTIVVSLGPEVIKVPIPNFVGQSIEWAQEQVNTLNLTCDVVEAQDEEHAKGTIIFQSIPAESTVEEGTKITFHIASGPTDDENPTGDPTGDPFAPGFDPTLPDPNPLPTGGEQPTFSSANVTLDLSAYMEQVQVRIEVGGVPQYNSPVDPVQMSTVSKQITGTGIQRVDIYVNNSLVKSYNHDFGG